MPNMVPHNPGHTGDVSEWNKYIIRMTLDVSFAGLFNSPDFRHVFCIAIVGIPADKSEKFIRDERHSQWRTDNFDAM
jgi:hypothetical protein